jgi:hypothetical protein
MQQASADEAKQRLDEIRRHLDQTLDALRQRTSETLDVKRQLQTNLTVQLTAAIALLSLTGVVLLMIRSRRRRSAYRRLRSKGQAFREDARAWIEAQRRLAKEQRSSEQAQLESRGGIARRLLVRALQTALPALAAAYAKRLLDRAAANRHPAHERMGAERGF